MKLSLRLCLSLFAVLALFVAGCGSQKETSSHPKSAKKEVDPTTSKTVDGVYAGTSIGISTTKKNAKEEAGPKSKRTADYSFKCLDAKCSKIYQRSNRADDTIQGHTVLFDVNDKANRWTSVSSRSFPCATATTGVPKGTFTEKIDWKYTRAKDGSLQGTFDQTVTGCKLDSVSHFTISFDGKKKSSLVYASGSEAAALKQMLTKYDATIADVYKSYNTCSKDFYAGEFKSVPAGGVCMGRMINRWQAGLVTLQKAASARPMSAPEGSCKMGFDQLPRQTILMLRTMKTTSAVLVKAKSSRDYRPAGKAMDALLTRNGKHQPLVLSLATQCIAPDDLTALGVDGKLAMDVNGSIKPLPKPVYGPPVPADLAKGL